MKIEKRYNKLGKNAKSLSSIGYFLMFMLMTLFIVSCRENKLREALDYAGKNKPQLEMVLTHYRNDPNPLKLKAAEFLIENMQGHYSLVGDDLLAYYRELDLILDSDTTVERKNERIKEVHTTYSNLWSKKIEDIKILSGEYLIRNIDRAFDMWENGKWARHLDFEQFCEYLLPYKCIEYQQLDYWRDTLSTKFNTTIANEPLNDQYLNSAFHAADLINKEMKSHFKSGPLNSLFKNKDYPCLNSSIYKMPCSDCFDYATLGVSVFRSHGLPAMIDHTPLWGQGSNGHAWYTLLNNDGKFLPFKWGLDSNPGDVFFPYDPIPKVFRFCYAADEKREDYIQNAVYKHPQFDLFEKDVTSEYMRTSNLSIPVITGNLKDKYVYLSVFNERTWGIVDLGTVRGKQAEFTHVGRKVAYLVLGYDGKELVPISQPFLLKENGEVVYCVADTTQYLQVYLTRKYPKQERTAVRESWSIGGEIQVSDNAQFSPYKTLYKIESLDYPDRIPLKADKKYRYWRFYSAKNGYVNISELQFYEAGSDSIAKGKIIGTGKSYDDDPLTRMPSAFDGNWLTYFQSDLPDDGWVGLDFGKPVSIDRVRYVARSDDNSIHTGDTYELKYWGDRGWQSLGKQIATERKLCFTIPRNALLLLRNHTRGKQERIFVYENDRQVWW